MPALVQIQRRIEDQHQAKADAEERFTAQQEAERRRAQRNNRRSNKLLYVAIFAMGMTWLGYPMFLSAIASEGAKPGPILAKSELIEKGLWIEKSNPEKVRHGR